jgi:hypothetical protein
VSCESSAHTFHAVQAKGLAQAAAAAFHRLSQDDVELDEELEELLEGLVLLVVELLDELDEEELLDDPVEERLSLR